MSGNGSQRNKLTSTSRIFQTRHSLVLDSNFLSTHDHRLMLHALEFGGNRSCSLLSSGPLSGLLIALSGYWFFPDSYISRGGSRGWALGAEAPPFIFRLYLINILSIIMKFCLSIIILSLIIQILIKPPYKHLSKVLSVDLC